MISNLYLLSHCILYSGLLTMGLPGVFLAALVEMKYHRIQRLLNRVSEDGLEAEPGLVIFYGASPELAALGWVTYPQS